MKIITASTYTCLHLKSRCWLLFSGMTFYPSRKKSTEKSRVIKWNHQILVTSQPCSHPPTKYHLTPPPFCFHHQGNLVIEIETTFSYLEIFPFLIYSVLSFCKFWIYRVAANTKFTTWQLVDSIMRIRGFEAGWLQFEMNHQIYLEF